jgi:DUF1365 family protein
MHPLEFLSLYLHSAGRIRVDFDRQRCEPVAHSLSYKAHLEFLDCSSVSISSPSTRLFARYIDGQYSSYAYPE